jgi:hypothetical protein
VGARSVERLKRDERSKITCSPCGLRRWTQELQAREITIPIRLCDECYWQGEFAQLLNGDPVAAAPTVRH